MKCLLFPSNTSSTKITATSLHQHSSMGASTGNSAAAAGTAAFPGAINHNQSSSIHATGLNYSTQSEDEIMWEAPQLNMPSTPYRNSIPNAKHQYSMSIDNNCDYSGMLPMSMGMGARSSGLSSNVCSPPSTPMMHANFDSNTAAAAAAAQSHVYSMRPISSSPGEKRSRQSNNSAAVSNPMSPLACQQNQMSSGAGSSSNNSHKFDYNDDATAYNDDNGIGNSSTGYVLYSTHDYGATNDQSQKHRQCKASNSKPDSSTCELEHQMESLSNFGDNCSVATSRGKRRGKHKQRSSSRKSNSGYQTPSGGSTSVGTAATSLSKSHRRFGGSMSSVSTRSHRSKRRVASGGHNRATSRPCDKRGPSSKREKEPLATFNNLAASRFGNDDNSSSTCDCACALKLTQLEKMLESFRKAFLEEMQYSIEYNNARWAKFDKRYMKELRNMGNFFQYRFETERTECIERLMCKAENEKAVFFQQLNNAEERWQRNIAAHGNCNSSFTVQKQPPRRHSLTDVDFLKHEYSLARDYHLETEQRVDDVGLSQLKETSTTGNGVVGNNVLLSEAGTPISSEAGSGGGGGGGGVWYVTRDSGIFDASHSSEINSNHNNSSSDISSPCVTQPPQISLSNINLKTRSSRRVKNDAAVLTLQGNGSYGNEPANIQPQARLNFLALTKRESLQNQSNTAITDSEYENELTLKQLPVLRSLPSEKLTLHENVPSASKQGGSAKTSELMANGFADLSIETQGGNSSSSNAKAASSHVSAFQQSGGHGLHYAKSVGMPPSPELSRVARKIFNVPSSPGPGVVHSPIRSHCASESQTSSLTLQSPSASSYSHHQRKENQMHGLVCKKGSDATSSPHFSPLSPRRNFKDRKATVPSQNLGSI